MEKIFKINKKIKPLVKIPDFTFVDYHKIQPSICYYIRKIDAYNNFDIVEARIVRTSNNLKNRYTLGAGTTFKILDSFMVSYLKHKKEKLNYKEFINKSLKENNMDTKTYHQIYDNGSLPKEYKETNDYKKLINNDYKILYVSHSSKEKTIEQIYTVFVKEVKQKLIDTEINYVIFKPVSLMVRPSYLQTKSGTKYSVFEYPELNIPTSILN